MIFLKISSFLEKSASFNPTKKTYQISVINLCEKIEKQEITLPLYQRDVSWTIPKAVDLLNYQLLGKAPVAPISINEINRIDNNTVIQISLIDREIVDNIRTGQLSIADGQQRLTTNYKAYINHSDFRNIVLDMVKGCFIEVDKSIKNYQIPVGVLLNKDNNIFFRYMNDNPTLRKPDIMSILMQIRSKLRDYNYTINLAEDLSEDEQIEWFEVLNNAGSRVTRVQMRFSKLRIQGIDIYTQYTNKFRDKIEEAGMDLFKVKDTEVSIPVAALNPAYEVITEKEHSPNYTPIPSDVRENQLCSLDAEQLKKCFHTTLESLDRTINFIEDNHLRKPTRIDYITYLTGLFVFMKDKEITDTHTNKIIEWYTTVNFSNQSNTERREIFTSLLNEVLSA